MKSNALVSWSSWRTAWRVGRHSGRRLGLRSGQRLGPPIVRHAGRRAGRHAGRRTGLLRAVVLVVLVLGWLLAAPSAAARPRSVGYYTEAGAGATFFLGTTASYGAPGLGFDLRLGRDLASWISVGLQLGISTHEATVPPPPEGEHFQLYTGTADLRLGGSVGPFALFVDGGAGLGLISSNALARVAILDPGESLSLAVRAGAGAEYQLMNRHYAIGLAGQWMMMPGFADTQGVSARVYLRYTY